MSINSPMPNEKAALAGTSGTPGNTNRYVTNSDPRLGGGTVPTGTGFRHTTAGGEDAATKLVDTADINAAQVTYAKIQNVSATDKVLGRVSVGAGSIEEITVTAAGRALIDDADATTQRTTLGLGNVDNTSDASKPISTAEQTALNLKANLAGPTFTGTVGLPAGTVTLAMQANMATGSLVYRKTALAGAPEVNTLATLKTDLALAKADVGLGSVDNTADTAKPISTATQTALDAKKTDSMSTNKLLGRGTAATGPIEEITLGTNLSFTGTTLNAAGGGGVADGDKGDVTVSASGATWTIDAAAVTLAKQANVATGTVFYRKTALAGSPEVQTLATLKTDLALAKADVGLGSVDNTSDAGKPVSTAAQAALDLKANLAGPTFTGSVTLPAGTVSLAMQANMATASVMYRKTAGAGAPEVNTLATLKTDLALVKADVGLGSVDNTADTAKPISTAVSTALNTRSSFYQTIMDCTGSHTAAKVAGTYALGQSVALAVSGTGTLYPINTIFIAAADYPTVNGLAAKLRIRAQLYTNDVAPTGNFTFGLYPITRPATSGGAGLVIYTLGTVVVNSTVLFTAPAADGLLNANSIDFALPTDGHYCIGVVTTATVAVSAHLHLSAMLQIHNA